MSEPLNIVLVEPEIPQNTGNIARTCACTGTRLHLVEPMGFRLTTSSLRVPAVTTGTRSNLSAGRAPRRSSRRTVGSELHLFTGQAHRSFAEVFYGPGAFLVFGRESRGLGLGIIEAHADRCVRIPMREGLRSLNLSNAVAVAVYEALRQQGYYGLGGCAGA